VTLQFGFYNSSNGDRIYDAEDISELFDSIIGDGIVRGFGSEFKVTALGGTSLSIGTGRSWFRSTWTWNDNDMPYTAEAADAANTRIDAIILEVDKSAASRTNSIRTIKGVAASSAVRPTLEQTDTKGQYPIAWITRRAGVATVLQSDISPAVGIDTPYASAKLINAATETPIMHRNVFRGKNLGSTVTAAQSAAIAAQTFEDLYVGDYWLINGITWRIVDLNYFMRKGRSGSMITTPHVVVMPDKNLVTTAWNINRPMTKGYVTSTVDQSVANIGRAGGAAYTSFGSKILMVDIRQSNAQDGNGYVVGADWYGVYAQTPNVYQMLGTTIFGPLAYGGEVPPAIMTESPTQFALFRLAPDFIMSSDNVSSWLRDAVSKNHAAVIGGGGSNSSTGDRALVETRLGVRPVIVIR
jgi:hypothetical protein